MTDRGPRARHAIAERGRPRDLGQATVELALALPVVLLLLLGVLQVSLVAREQVLVTHATREAARLVAVRRDDAGVVATVTRAGLDPRRARVTVDGRIASGEHATVRVTYRVVTDVPLVGPLLSDFELRESVTVRVE